MWCQSAEEIEKIKPKPKKSVCYEAQQEKGNLKDLLYNYRLKENSKQGRGCACRSIHERIEKPL